MNAALRAAVAACLLAAPAHGQSTTEETRIGSDPWLSPVDPASSEAPSRCAAAAYMVVVMMSAGPPDRVAETLRTRNVFMAAAVDADAGRVVEQPLANMPVHVAEAIRADGARYLATLQTRSGEDGGFSRFLLDDMDLCIEYLVALTERLADP